jgi:hypothetical protein
MTAEQRIIAEFAVHITDLKTRLRAIREAAEGLDELLGGSETARLIAQIAAEGLGQ